MICQQLEFIDDLHFKVRSHLADKCCPTVLNTKDSSSAGCGGGRKLSNGYAVVPYRKANGLIGRG
jgi:hypothetical protein